MVAPLDLRAAVRLHLAELTPLRRAALARGEDPLGEGARARDAVTDRQVSDEIARCRDRGVSLVTPEHPHWPPLLRELPDPPVVLWVRGELPDPGRLPVAVVGPRKPTPYGLTMARRLASELAELGCVVVSGGARGVDARAHLAALEAGGPTVAILGCGADVAYPPEHRELFARIAGCGAVVSEHPCGAPPLKHHFPVRNRLLAGWTRAVAVVEATFKSGSLITARLALEQGREVLAVPGPVTSRLSEGCNELLASGARVLRTAQDVLDELRPDESGPLLAARAARAQDGSRAAAESPPDLARADGLAAALSPGEARSVDELLEATGLRVGELLARLVALEAAGGAESLPGGLWLRRDPGR